MTINNDILDELKQISPLLAGIEKVNVFSIPDGYFNDLDEVILAGIKENDIVVMNGISKDTFFEIPQDYFETLSDTILNKIKNQQTENTGDELRVLSPMLYSSQNEKTFEVPQGYFNSLADTVLNRIKNQQTENAGEELRILSPMLYSIQNEKTFEAPQGYFNSLADTILAKVKSQPAKVVIMHKRRTFLKYAAAAVITCSMALGVYKFVEKPSHNDGSLAVASLAPSIQKGIKMDDTQFNNTLNNLSQDDIANYLEKNSNDDDVATLSSSIDENTLPSQDDYLSDDKTLDNYLNEINNTNQTNN